MSVHKPSITHYLQFTPDHILCINSNVKFNETQLVRGFEVRHRGEIGKPKSEYISDLVKLYGDYQFHFVNPLKEYGRILRESFFWPTVYGGVILEYTEQKRSKSDNIAFYCTVKIFDKAAYIKALKILQSYTGVVEKKSPIKDNYSSPKIIPVKYPGLYLTHQQIFKRHGVHVGDKFSTAFDRLRHLPALKDKKIKYWMRIEFDEKYSVYYTAILRWHKDKRIHNLQVSHSKDLGSRQDFLQKMKNTYGDYTHAYLSRSRSYYYIKYIWKLPNFNAVTYTYSSRSSDDKPHKIGFYSGYGFIELMKAYFTYNVEVYR